MNKINNPCHAKRRFASLVSLCLAALLLSQQGAFGAITRAPTASVRVQSKVTVVGILSFRDESDSGAPAELGKKTAQQLKQRLSLNFKDVLPKSLPPNSDATPDTALTLEQVVALGKQNAVQFVIRGGILTIAVTQSNITVQIYAEVISVESGAVNVARAEGTAAGNSIQWSKVDLNSAGFSATALGTAFAAAIDSLAASVHNTLLSPVADASPAGLSPAETLTDGGETAGSTSPAEVAAADADEELQQLIAQAEEVVANGTGDANSLRAVSSGLQKVKAALTTKASMIKDGGDPTNGDQEVAVAKSELQAALTSVTEQTTSKTGLTEAAEPAGEKKSLLGTIEQRASEALGILQKIQEMRAALRGIKGGANGGESAEGTGIESSAQPTEDISGVVMDEGEPLAGVEVTVKDSGVTAMTGPDGSYTLKAVPSGRPSTLVLRKKGKQVAVGQINLLRGRPATADFQLRANTVSGATALRIIPSTVVLKPNSKAGATGMLKGTAKDRADNPVPRALIRLQRQTGAKDQLAVARTDSQGRYTFMNVPAGEHQVTIQKSGLSPITNRVTVRPNAATEAQSKLTTVPQRMSQDRQGTSGRPSDGVKTLGSSRDRALAPASTTDSSQPLGALRGLVVDAVTRRPIGGASVLIAGRRVKTDQAGNFAIADIASGNYQVKITSVGFSEEPQSITIRDGASSRKEFALKRLADANRIVRVAPETPRVSAAVRVGQVRGRVVDAASGVPVAGAVVAVSGQRTVVTRSDGSFSLNALSPGTYQVSITRAGFAEKRAVLTIRAGESITADFRLTATNRRSNR